MKTDLLFQYTVAAGENSADLNYADINSLKLNGGTITATTNDDTLTLRLPAVDSANSLAGSSDVIVDTMSPTFASAAATDEDTIDNYRIRTPCGNRYYRWLYHYRQCLYC